jgi:CHRD domain-containing protein
MMNRAHKALLAGAAAASLGTAGGIKALAAGDADWPVLGSANGANELTKAGKRGAGDLNGYAGVTLSGKGTKLCFGLTVSGIEAPVASHIHRGAANKSGGVVVALTQPKTGDPGSSSGCVVVTRKLSTEILTHPARFYVNVHTKKYPNGAVRGQLFRKG